jgi:hypothetical protein
MKVNVIRGFWQANEQGRDLQFLAPGEQEVRDDLVRGLISEGYVEAPAGHPPVPMSPGRRAEIIGTLLAAGREQLQSATDDELLAAMDALHSPPRRRPREPAETKIVAPEHTGAPEPMAAADEEQTQRSRRARPATS